MGRKEALGASALIDAVNLWMLMLEAWLLLLLLQHACSCLDLSFSFLLYFSFLFFPCSQHDEPIQQSPY